MTSTKVTSPSSPLPPPTPLSALLPPVPESSNSLSLPSLSPSPVSSLNVCLTCGEEIRDSAFIRVASHKFHKDHFLCCECQCNLHGGKFHHKDGKFYCSSHYMEKFCHPCRECGEKIGSGSMISAFNHFYHPEHFVCHQCGCPFVNGKYYEAEDFPYCELHFQERTLEKCSKCGQPVKQEEATRLGSAVYHSSCLSCFHCGCVLGEKGQAFQKDGRMFCQADYFSLYCKRCTKCGDFLLKHCISVNSEVYHPTCLKCDVCGVQLEKYICVSGHLRCSQHSEVKGDTFTCDVCHLDIVEGKEVVLSVGKHFHSPCFACHKCKKPLDKATCKLLKDDTVCCPECLIKQGIGGTVEAPTTAGVIDKTPKVSSGGGNSKNLRVDSTKPSDESKSPDSGRQPPSGSRRERKRHSSGIHYSPSNPSPPVPPPAPPKIDWKKGELIGKGSFGKVYMGMNIGTGELIAVKQVRLSTTEELEQATAIQNEISLMENLRHPNIVCFLGTQRNGNRLNILMEYVPGKSLDFLLDKFGALYEKVIRSYTRQLLGALAYCHSNHVVHRDIKGKNILIDTKGNLKLADFGSAKRFENVLSKDAPSLSYNYTPLWTAPEVLTGDYNSKVDIWSLGCVIIEMASAKPPWSEQNFENPFRALYHIGNSDSIPAIPDSLSAEGKEFVRLCLTRDPDQRPTATEMLQHHWMEGLDMEDGAGLITGREDGGSDEGGDSEREFDDEGEDSNEDGDEDKGGREAEETKNKR